MRRLLIAMAALACVYPRPASGQASISCEHWLELPEDEQVPIMGVMMMGYAVAAVDVELFVEIVEAQSNMPAALSARPGKSLPADSLRMLAFGARSQVRALRKVVDWWGGKEEELAQALRLECEQDEHLQSSILLVLAWVLIEPFRD